MAEFRNHTLQDVKIMVLNTIVCCSIKTVGSHLKSLTWEIATVKIYSSSEVGYC
jgi:hypothetical protein